MAKSDSQQRRRDDAERAQRPGMVFTARLSACLVALTLLCASVTAHTGLPKQSAQQDGARAAAEALFAEGQRLYSVGTAAALQEALKKFTDALPFWREAHERRAEANTLSYIGKIYDTLGEQQRGLDYYNEALLILREIGDARSEAATLNNIGLIYYSLGEKKRALEFYNRALTVLHTAVDRQREAITLVNIGLTYDSLGEKQKALNYYQQALAIFRAIEDRASEAVTLNNIGLAYDSLGEQQRALDYFAQALEILKAAGEGRVEAVTLSNMGFVYDSLGEKQKALDYYERALPVLRATGARSKEAMTLNNIGLLHRSLDEHDRALEYFTQALKLRQTIGDRPGVAETLGDAGAVYMSLGQTEKALAAYQESLSLSRAVQDRRVEASTLRRLALLEEKRGNLPAARTQMEAALNIIETVRANITSQELRDSYFATVQQQFETYISLLMHMHRAEPLRGYDALALQQSERARARSMLEMLAEARADIRQGVAPALLAREHQLQSKLAVLGEKQTRLLNESHADSVQLAALKKEIGGALIEYQQVEADIRMSSPRYAALTQPVPLSLKEIQGQALDADTLLLEYSLGDEKSYLWAVTRTSMKSFELPARAEIEQAARVVYQLLTARKPIKFETAEEKKTRVEMADRAFPEAAARLSRLILQPVAAELGHKRLLIVGDGALSFIPFAALPVQHASDGAQSEYQPLMLEHEIVSLPSASTLVALRREVAGRRLAAKMLAVIADPVFNKDDERIKGSQREKKSSASSLRLLRVSAVNSDAPDTQANTQTQEEATTSIRRLPFTRLEANEILALVPAAQNKRALDFDASRATAMSAELGRYRYVHFATHGVLNSEHPELSGIVLSLVSRDGSEQDGFLWAHEVFNLHLPAELVVLSGCRTGLGKEIKGEGLVGLTRGFMYAGAARVVVSLWDISDEASAALMARFYKAMLGKEHLAPAAALRAAQLAIWKEQRWQAPYYWAAFVLQGETK